MKNYVSVIKNDFGVFALTDNGMFVTGLIRLLNTEIIPSDRPSSFSLFAKNALLEYFSGTRKDFNDVPILFHGTPFREKVWKALCKIPYGEIKTYGDIAGEIGCAGGGRAVGQAVHYNPILFMIPCHRIVARNGIGGFGAGLDLKIKLFNLEGISSQDKICQYT